MRKGDVVFNKVFGSGKIIEIFPNFAIIKFDSLKTIRTIKSGFFEKVER